MNPDQLEPVQARNHTTPMVVGGYLVPGSNSPTELARMLASRSGWLTDADGAVFDRDGEEIANSFEELAGLLANAGVFAGEPGKWVGFNWKGEWDPESRKSFGGIPDDADELTAWLRVIRMQGLD